MSAIQNHWQNWKKSVVEHQHLQQAGLTRVMSATDVAVPDVAVPGRCWLEPGTDYGLEILCKYCLLHLRLQPKQGWNIDKQIE